MPDQFVSVEGAEKLALLGKAIRKMGADRTILTNLSKRIKTMTPEIRTAIRASAVATLPHKGGLGAWVAKSRVSVSIRRGPATASVRIVTGRNSTGKRSDLADINAGSTRHMLFGNRKHWYPQTVVPGFVTNVVQGPLGDAFQAHTIAAIDDTIAQVLRGL